jgi:hypothetical protein
MQTPSDSYIGNCGVSTLANSFQGITTTITILVYHLFSVHPAGGRDTIDTIRYADWYRFWASVPRRNGGFIPLVVLSHLWVGLARDLISENHQLRLATV